MSEYTLAYFGEINADALKEYYEADLELDGRVIRIDLNFESKILDKQTTEQIKFFIENIARFAHQNKSLIQQDLETKNDSVVKSYIDVHIEELGKDFLEQLEISDKSNPAQQLLERLHLKRIGIYPDDKLCFGVFDYTIDNEKTDNLIVLKTDCRGNLDDIYWES